MQIEKRHRFYGWIAFLFVVFHFCMIFIYAAPSAVVGDRAKGVVVHYVEPVFRQTWSLFAPCPLVNSYTEVAFEFENNNRTEWIKVGEEYLEKHNWSRGLHYGEMVLLESNLMYAVNRDLGLVGVDIGDVATADQLDEYIALGYSVHRVRKYLYGLALFLFGEKPSKGYFRCWRKNVKTGLENVVELPMYKF